MAKAGVSDQIRRAARASGCPQVVLARKADLSPFALCRFLAGKSALSEEKLGRLARALNLEIVVRRGRGKRKAGRNRGL